MQGLGVPKRVESKEEENFVRAALAAVQSSDFAQRDKFRCHLNGAYWRGRRSLTAVDGSWCFMRKLPTVAPTLESLPSRLPGVVEKQLLASSHLNGGLIIFFGAPGAGKTYSASATLKSRLLQFGGLGFTAEDPCEHLLNGWHGDGYCIQNEVNNTSAQGWEETLRTLLRSQPAGGRSILFVGEVCDPDTARAMMRAAGNGFLVIATAFGDNIVNGIDGLFQMLGDEYAMTISSVLRLAVHQRRIGPRLRVVSLEVSDSESPIASLLRSRSVKQLDTYIHQQAIQANNRGSD